MRAKARAIRRIDVTQDLRLYDAIVWRRDPESIGQRMCRDPESIGQRMSVWAVDGDDALRQLQGQFGEDIICTLKNEEEANRSR